MPQAPALGEDLESTPAPESIDLHGHRLLEAAQVALGLLPAEQVVGRIAATGEELVGHLAPDELVGGQAEAGLVLGQAVEGADTGRREEAQEPVAGHVDHEGVAQRAARRRRRWAVGSRSMAQASWARTRRPPAPGGIGWTSGRGRPGTAGAYRLPKGAPVISGGAPGAGRYRGGSCPVPGTTDLSISAMTTTLDPPADASMSADAPSPPAGPRPLGVSLWVPAAIFVVVFLGGAILAFDPGQNAFDTWGFTALLPPLAVLVPAHRLLPRPGGR